MKVSKRTLAILICFCFFISIITPLIDFTKLDLRLGNPKTSTNYLFKDTPYNITLDNVYDDADPYKLYTDSYFQSQYKNDSTDLWDDKHNETTDSGTDNNEVEYGSPSGNYEATYSFENDADGSMPAGWTKSANVVAEIVAEKDGHNKVLHSTGTTVAWQKIYHYFSTDDFIPAGNYTIEFWAMMAQTNSRVDFYMIPAAVGIYFHSEGHLYTSKATDMGTYSANIWYHIRIDVKTDTYKYDVYINNVLKKANEGWYYAVPPNNYINAFTIEFRTLDPRELWFDAFGIKTGDYQSTESFDYTTTQGVYYGTYDFRDDTVGQVPVGWTGSSIGTATTTIISDFNNHIKVLQLYDPDASSAGVITNTFSSAKTSGTVEFWWGISDNSKTGYTYLRSAGTITIYLAIISGKFYHWDGVWHDTGITATNNILFHHRIIFNCATYTFDWYISGSLVLGGSEAFLNNVVSLDNFRLQTDTSSANFYTYYDAIGYSWDTTSHSGVGYKVGYNVNPYDLEPLLEQGWYSIYFNYGETVSVVNLDGHQNVLQLQSTGGYNYMIRPFTATYSDSFAEFWWRGSYSSIDSEFRFCGNLDIYTMAIGGYFKYYDSTPTLHSTGVAIVADTWYHHKITFDISAGTFDWYINSVLKVDDGDMFDHTGTYINQIRFHSTGTYYASLDALGLGWMSYTSGDNLESYDQDYEIGDNLYSNNINMIQGKYDNTDNMLTLNAVCSAFTSTHTEGTRYDSPAQFGDFTFTKGSSGVSGELETNNGANYATLISSTPTFYPLSAEYIDDVTYTAGSGTGLLSNTQTDDTNYYQLNYAFSDPFHTINAELIFDPALAGRDFYVSVHIEATTAIWFMGVSGTVFDYDNVIKEDVSSIIFFTLTDHAHNIKIYYLKLNEVGVTPAELDISATWIIPDSILTFFYDYRTNVSVDCDLDIYNWDTTVWLELKSATSTSFQTGNYALTDPYISVSNQVKIRFQTATYGNWFKIELDQLTVSYIDDPAELEFSILTPFLNYNRDLLSIHIESHQKTNISQQIYFKIWNYDTSSYDTITSATETTSITKREFNSAIPDKYISSSGVKLYWSGINSEDDFIFSIDYLLIRICYKMNLWHEVAFDTNGLWRYRWEIHGSLEYTDWTQFEVVDPIPNFHAISESDVTTRWILQGADISPVENFSDDITGSNWDLYGVSERYFDKNTIQSANYLLDNTTVSSDWGYSGTHFDVGVQAPLPYGITWDGTYFWVADLFMAEVYKYTSTGVYTGIHFDTSGEDLYPTGLFRSIGCVYILGTDTDEVYEYSTAGVYSGWHFDVGAQTVNPYGICWDGTFVYVIGITGTVYKYTAVGVYTGTSFSTLGSTDICYDGTYLWVISGISSEAYKYTTVGVYTGVHFDVGSEDNDPYGITRDGAYLWIIGDQHDDVYKYELLTTISKNYLGSGYMYMQTDTTELISLLSTDYGSHYTLSSGDYFEVDFQTSSDSQINLILLKDGVVQKTLTLSQSGNTNFNRHTAQISVSENLEFDQLKISSTFEDTDNVKVYDIKTMKYTLTGDYENFVVGSKRTVDVYLIPDDYNLKISDYSSGLGLVDINITIPATDHYVYTPTPTKQCRIAFFNPDDIPLVFTDYHVYVNRSLGGSYSPFTLLENIFSVDVNTIVYINITDRFNSLIRTYEKEITPTTEYLDIELEVYQLQIKNLMEYKTTVDINNNSYRYPLLSGDSLYFLLVENNYWIGYYDSNGDYKQFTIYLNENQAYELNRSKICFLAFVNQKGEHLYFDNYKTYINGTLLYENIFYKEIGDDIGIEVKDLYDISVKNQTYTVISGDNYIPVILTLFSLKVMSQQLVFNHINITRDPNYYSSSYYWSEWIAPSEIIKFNLFAGYYKINLTNNEAGSSNYYSYTLNGDDVLLIGSNNTIYNVLVNLANVNATIGNQITNVQIDLTNQNSYINNSIINVEINLGNINSTLGNMLVNLDVNVNNIANNISALYVFTNNSFINLGNDINVSFIYMENNIISINQSISNLIIGISNDIYLINGTISTMITQMGNNLLLMNVSLNAALFDIDTTINEIGSNITNNFILLNNSIYLNNLNINDSRIAIINNLLLVNNTLSNLIAQVYSSVYLINNSIYTAVVDLGTYLSLMNNTIYGNMSIVLQMNEFLSALYQKTMFSQLLNWTNIGYNTSLIESQIDVWTFINHYINQSIEIHLKYQDQIEKLVISADNFKDQWLPKYDTSYNLWSVEDEKYLDEWQELDPDNKTVDFGFFEEVVPYDPTPIATTYLTLFIGVIFFVGIAFGVIKLNNKLKERKTPIPPEVLKYMNKTNYKKHQDGVVDDRI